MIDEAARPCLTTHKEKKTALSTSSKSNHNKMGNILVVRLKNLLSNNPVT